MSGRAGQRAFTLVELLAVVAVVGVLASLGLGALSRGKAQAQSVVCRANLKQMSLALGLYLQDGRFYPPTFYMSETEGSVVAGWKFLLNPYLAHAFQNPIPDGSTEPIDRIFCPAADVRPMGDPDPDGFASFAPGFGCQTYGYNSHGMTIKAGSSLGRKYAQAELGLSGWGAIDPNGSQTTVSEPGGGWVTTVPWLWHGVSEADLAAPGDMLVFGDAYAGRPGSYIQTESMLGFLINIPEDPGAYGLAFIAKTAEKRHQGRLNTMLCDGHIEATRVETLFGDRDDTLARWNRDHEPHRDLIQR